LQPRKLRALTDVAGAEDGNVFCNRCTCEFNPETGATWIGDGNA
jgi:hypothetical protein